IGENVCAEPYGYYNTSGGTTKISSIPTSGTSSNTGIMAFDFMSSRNVNFTLPIKEGYISGVETVKAPTASYAGGKVPYETRIVLSTQTDGADIYYTTDGSEPTVNSSKYTQPIILTNDTILKAMAVKDGMTSSSVSTYTYIVQTDDLYKITAGQYDAVINGNILTMDVAPVADNGNIYAPVRFLGEAMGASVSYNSELGQVTYYISGKSVTYTIGDKDCFIINGRTMVNAKTLLKDLLGDGYKVECNGISVVANEKTAEDICPVTTKTTIQAVGSYYLAAIAVNNPTDDMKILIAAYDESGKMLCAEFADMSTMQAILSKETGIAYFKTFVLGANLKPLSFAEIAY
ncbi:MAG: chitobiase/beta-hexosaminidase C-terminal domain-containing protein, partial [Clostridia bacterium]|nr:chitobiase/beta-hexosaminidase C-terminal domain-containing protein [Clostridia bacterium]